MKGGSGKAPVERQPEAARGVRATLEITIEHQFGGVGRVRDRWLLQPQPVLNVPNAQENVPAVLGLPDCAGGKFGKTKYAAVGRRRAPNNRNDCRQNFRCPEYGLILRRPRRVSYKSRGPISF